MSDATLVELRDELTAVAAEPLRARWAIVDVRGQRAVGGRITAQLIGGICFLRVDACDGDGQESIRLYPVGDIACIMLTTKELALALAARRHSVTIEHVQRAVVLYYRVPTGELDRSRGGRGMARARQVAMYLAYELTGASLTAVGRAFGARHHTTAMRAIASLRRALALDPEVRREVDSVRAWVDHEAQVTQWLESV